MAENEEAENEAVRLLREIRDGQRTQLELQREQLAFVRRQAERTERIQDRAETLQAGSADIMTTARRALSIVLPIVALLIAYLSWLLFR